MYAGNTASCWPSWRRRSVAALQLSPPSCCFTLATLMLENAYLGLNGAYHPNGWAEFPDFDVVVGMPP